MAFEQLFLFALGLLILGNGAFKPNISTQVGELYAPGDRRRDRAFSIFYVGINLGAFLAPLICGTLGEELGWHYGFAAAGFGMTAGLVIYLLATPHLPKDAFDRRKSPAAAIDKDGWRSIFALLLLFLPVSLFWATYEQQGNSIALWADQFTDRRLLGGEIPVTWFQAFNPFMIFAFTPFVVAFWRYQGPNEPSTTMKLAIGCFLTALAYLVMALAAWNAGAGKVSWVWLLAYFVVITIGELYLSPTSLSLVTKIAPASLLSTDDGYLARDQFCRKFPRRLPRQLLVEHGKDRVLSHAGDNFRYGLRGHRPVELSAALGLAGLVERKPDILFGQRGRRSLRAGQIVKIGQLASAIKSGLVREAMHDLGHPPGKPLSLPHAPQTRCRICFQ